MIASFALVVGYLFAAGVLGVGLACFCYLLCGAVVSLTGDRRNRRDHHE